MKLGYESNTWGPIVGDATGITSIKDLFYRSEGDTLKSIREVGECGYQGIEIFDGNVMDFADDLSTFKQALTDAGLELAGVYTGGNFIYPEVLPEELHKVQQSIDVAAAAGATFLVVGGGAKRATGTTDEDYTLLAQALDTIHDMAAEKDLIAVYHPHLTTICETAEQIDTLLERSKIAFCPDTGHIAAAGSDAAAVVKKWLHRMPIIHLKDVQPEPFDFKPLGDGVVDTRAIVAELADAKFDGWVVIELDAHEDPKGAAALNKTRIDALFAEFGLSYEGK